MSRLRALLLIVVAGFGGPALAQGVTLPEYHLVELDNGAVFILSEKHDVPLIGVTHLLGDIDNVVVG